jgi:hypothetical protein
MRSHLLLGNMHRSYCHLLSKLMRPEPNFAYLALKNSIIFTQFLYNFFTRIYHQAAISGADMKNH